MNRYPWWKYAILVVAVIVGLLYTLPNFFGNAPAVQVSSAKATVKVDDRLLDRVGQVLAAGGVKPGTLQLEGLTIKARFADTDTQIRARDLLDRALNEGNTADPTYTVALNLVSGSPAFLSFFRAFPMYLGLDLRGGVHFLLQVDMRAALNKKVESAAGDVRSLLRDKNIRHAGVTRDGDRVVLMLRDKPTMDRSLELLNDQLPDLQWTATAEGTEFKLAGQLKPQALKAVQDAAIKQNITTLNNRVAGLGTSEPVIQQQGADRIVVQLPGLQDTAKAKEMIGRTATLEMRLVDDSAEATAALGGGGPVPFGSERFAERDRGAIVVKRQVIVTGDNLTDAQANFDQQTHEPIIMLTLDAKGARAMKDVSAENVGKRMAILLFEKGRGEVVTAPRINSELGARFQITGRMTTQEANDQALLLRSGSLAAPMEIIEERAIGPSLGAENIAKGFNSVMYGFAAITVFMCVYYMLFGLFSTLSLAVNLLLLVAVLSMIQTTLTLPGIAAIALTLGMAIDANVLINERVREELRAGSSPQAAIAAGYERAFATILDSNVTTFIAGLALLVFGSGPIRGFAIVHCLGILTSMFSAVLFSRGLVNLWYGRQKKLKSVSIGQVWKPKASTDAAGPSSS
jgi:preprotein translocase subunit SecD